MQHTPCHHSCVEVYRHISACMYMHNSSLWKVQGQSLEGCIRISTNSLEENWAPGWGTEEPAAHSVRMYLENFVLCVCITYSKMIFPVEFSPLLICVRLSPRAPFSE